jgi:type IV pilus assembly protein PilB
VDPQRLKGILVKNKYLSEERFDALQKEAEAKKLPIETILVQKGIIRDEELGMLISRYLGFPFLYLQRAHVEGITPKLLSYIPEVVAFAQEAIVFDETEDTLRLVTSNPENYEFIKQLEQKTGKKVEVYYTTPFNLELALRRYRGDIRYEINQIIEKSKKQPAILEESVVRLVNLLIEHAYLNQATDIHFTPSFESASVRVRIDGILYKIAEYPLELQDRIASRIKVMANLRIDEKLAPQDGRFTFEMKEDKVDVRVSVMPITHGENVVLRLLGQRGKKFTLKELGLSFHDLRKVERASQGSWGMIISAGPTGSGKTTTMYAIIHLLNRPEVNIMTIEDPIEYKIEGIQQIQVNPKKNITFASGLRHILRQNPDIILVGEIRDEETARIAINAAMTGHLVLTTLHANDAATALVRLIEMGVQPFLVASAVSIVIAQRLVRKTCPYCAERVNLTARQIELISRNPELEKALKEVAEVEDLSKIQIYRGKGCKFCDWTGYLGRTGIFEVLPVTTEIQRLIVKRAPAGEIQKKAIEEGMKPMVYDGANKIIVGTTTPEEVLKVMRA